MITPITELRVSKALNFLQALYDRANSDEIRAQYNVSAPSHDQEELHGFERGDASGIFSTIQILAEMERLKYNEKVFMTWLDISFNGDWPSRDETLEAFEKYKIDCAELEATEAAQGCS